MSTKSTPIPTGISAYKAADGSTQSSYETKPEPSAHTATPWEAKPAADGHGDFGIVDGSVVIAEVFCDLRHADEHNIKQARANAEFIVRACNEYDELKLKATHYEWLLNEARKTGVTVRFVNDGKHMCVSGGIIKESLVDDLVTALEVAKKELTHDVPGSCYATGPLTGNYIEDLIVCPGCRAIEQIDAAIAAGIGAA